MLGLLQFGQHHKSVSLTVTCSLEKKTWKFLSVPQIPFVDFCNNNNFYLFDSCHVRKYDENSNIHNLNQGDIMIFFFLMNEETGSGHFIFPSSQLLVTGGATQV